MPIKEIITFGIGVLAVLFATNPLHFREAVHRTQFQILREVARTDNWGNPSLWASHSKSKIHSTRSK